MSDQNILEQGGESRDLAVSIPGIPITRVGETSIEVQRSSEHDGCWLAVKIDRKPYYVIERVGLTHEQMNYLIQALEWCR